MSSVEPPEPVQLNVFHRDLSPSGGDLQNKARKLNLANQHEGQGCAPANQNTDNNSKESVVKELAATKETVGKELQGDAVVEKTDREKSVGQERLEEQCLSEETFKETSLENATGGSESADFVKELLDGYMGDATDGYHNFGFEDNLEEELEVPNTEVTDLSQDNKEITEVEGSTPESGSHKLDLLEESELVIEGDTDFKDALKEKIVKRKESFKKNFTEGKDNIKDKVLKRKESLKQNIDNKKESLKQNKESLKHNISEGKEDIMRQLSLFRNKVEAGVNQKVRNIAAHIPSVTSPQEVKPPPMRTLEVRKSNN